MKCVDITKSKVNAPKWLSSL